MSAFRPARLGPADLTTLVTDPDLASSLGATEAAIKARVTAEAVATRGAVSALDTTLAPVINTRASQASVDALGSTLGPAIVNATADKATSAQLAAATSAITAAINANGLMPREARTFPANAVPSNFSAMEGTQYVPAGGIVVPSAASLASGAGDAVFVSDGPGAGLWRFSAGVLQRYDISSNAAAGSSYSVPGYAAATAVAPAIAVSGTKIYMTSLQFSTGVASARAFMFDTATLAFTEVASLPRALVSGGTGLARAVRLPDGRILITATSAAGLTITAAETPFWIYDPVADTTPIERIVALPITKFMDVNIGPGMQRMPSGALLLVDVVAPAAGNALSCLLTVNGNVITAGAAMDTLVAANVLNVLLPTAGGVLFGTTATMRAFTEGGAGWSTASVPWSYGTQSHNGMRSRSIPGVGTAIVGTQNTGGMKLGVSLWFTGAPLLGSSLITAVKNT